MRLVDLGLVELGLVDLRDLRLVDWFTRGIA